MKTRKQFEQYFKANIEPSINNDLPALRQAWNDTIDALCRERTLPERARDWSHPRRFYRYGSKENPKRASGHKKKIKTIDINALEWFDKAAGNSYFAATAIVDYQLPTEKRIVISFQYGYGTHYITKAAQAMEKEGLLPGLEQHQNSITEPLWKYCERKRIVLRYSKQEGCKKKDLMELSAN